MPRLLVLALVALSSLGHLNASACEKHLNGHQNSSDTNVEGSRQ